MFSECTSPPLTTVVIDWCRLGYLTASLLDQQLRGEAVPAMNVLSEMNVVVRGSTDVVACDAPDVAEAIDFIWRSVDRAIGVEDVAEHRGISARTVLRRFMVVLGRSAADEIRRSRLETAKRLLMGTDRPLQHIALDAGYVAQSSLGREIKKATGLTPGQLRRQYRG